MELNTLPTTVVRTGLLGLRLPLTVAERLSGSTLASWTPAQRYETWEAETKQVLGSVLHDDRLVREGRRQQAQLSELAPAERLTDQASETRRAADLTVRQHRAADEELQAERDLVAQRARLQSASTAR